MWQWHAWLLGPLVIFQSLFIENDGQPADKPEDYSRNRAAELVSTLTATSFPEAVSGRFCRGPTAVLFSGEDLGPENAALEEFSGAAKEFNGVACFYAINCLHWQNVCSDHNLRRTPAVVVYPSVPAAAQKLQGDIEKQAVSMAITRLIAAADRAVALSSENLDGFLLDPTRPVKVLLFSARKATPVILQGLSSDRDLWPLVHFGFVRHTDVQCMEKFRVKEVPFLIMQRGANHSTREVYSGGVLSGELSVESLRNWIYERAKAQTVDPGVAGILKAVEGKIVQEEVDHSAEEGSGKAAQERRDVEYVTSRFEQATDAAAQSPSPAGPPTSSEASAKKPGRRKAAKSSPSVKNGQYQRLAFGAEGCPPGLEITIVQECELAIMGLGIGANPKWVASYPGLPRYCSVRERPAGDGERMHFNSSPEGKGRSDLAPICKVGDGGPVAAKNPSESIQELTGLNKDKVLSGDGFYLVYLREGPITEEETAMLLELKERFNSQLENQGTKLSWLWMNLFIERKIKGLLDPPVLPSAMVLNPHKRPRFALVKHDDDEEGEPSPADESSISLLLNTVLGGDATFTNLPPKALQNKWAERAS